MSRRPGMAGNGSAVKDKDTKSLPSMFLLFASSCLPDSALLYVGPICRAAEGEQQLTGVYSLRQAEASSLSGCWSFLAHQGSAPRRCHHLPKRYVSPPPFLSRRGQSQQAPCEKPNSASPDANAFQAFAASSPSSRPSATASATPPTLRCCTSRSPSCPSACSSTSWTGGWRGGGRRVA